MRKAAYIYIYIYIYLCVYIYIYISLAPCRYWHASERPTRRGATQCGTSMPTRASKIPADGSAALLCDCPRSRSLHFRPYLRLF